MHGWAHPTHGVIPADVAGACSSSTPLTLPPTAGPLDAACALTFGPTGQLRDQDALQRALRTLLWKHAIPAYNNSQLNTVELAERLASNDSKRPRKSDGRHLRGMRPGWKSPCPQLSF